jgi:hypothetical protein
VEEILKAVPARRTLLIHESIQARRISIVNLAFPKLQSISNFSAVKIASIIHAWYAVFNFMFGFSFKIKENSRFGGKYLYSWVPFGGPFLLRNTWEVLQNSKT